MNSWQHKVTRQPTSECICNSHIPRQLREFIYFSYGNHEPGFCLRAPIECVFFLAFVNCHRNELISVDSIWFRQKFVWENVCYQSAKGLSGDGNTSFYHANCGNTNVRENHTHTSFLGSTLTAMCKIFRGSAFCNRTPGRWATGFVSLGFPSEIHLFAFSLADTGGCEEGASEGDLAFDNSALESGYCQQQRTLLAKTSKCKKCFQLPLQFREGTKPFWTSGTFP